MKRYTRAVLAVATTFLLTVALVAPAMGQTGPYEPEEPPAEEPDVEGVVEDREEPAEEADVDAEEDAVEDVAEVRGVTLARTGADTLLLVVAGLLALGLGGLMLVRSRNRGTPGA